jgi:hypothetical protein
MILSRSVALPAGASVAFGYTPARMKRREFEQLVEEALGELPACYRALLSNIVIIVEDYPPGEPPAPAPSGGTRGGRGTSRTGAGVCCRC